MRNLLNLIIIPFCLMCISTGAQGAEHGKASRISGATRLPKAGTVFSDCPGCPAMVVVPAGRFEMGSPDSEEARSDDEGPMHRVRVSAFALGRTEITLGQFAKFVQDTKYSVGDNCRTLEDGKFEMRSGRSWRDPGFPQNSQYPVSCISWNDARAYAQWLSRKTGKQYRLPTEAEWEYAARARTVTARYWGNSPDKACRYANVADMAAKAKITSASFWLLHNCRDGFAYTAPVGRFKANAFGLKDMLGNLWEWTEDSYHDSYDSAPDAGNAWQGDGKKRVIRGGSWNNSPERVRAAKRGRDNPNSRFCNIGFRLARSLP
ncbi:MAG: formylglycine-generating enzyme family protein [Gammaproteobacteria bacterium]|nr:formylglycine-generating enzyme family protein [Gammaproteobacteria bacterium]